MPVCFNTTWNLRINITGSGSCGIQNQVVSALRGSEPLVMLYSFSVSSGTVGELVLFASSIDNSVDTVEKRSAFPGRNTL